VVSPSEIGRDQIRHSSVHRLHGFLYRED